MRRRRQRFCRGNVLRRKQRDRRQSIERRGEFLLSDPHIGLPLLPSPPGGPGGPGGGADDPIFRQQRVAFHPIDSRPRHSRSRSRPEMRRQKRLHHAHVLVACQIWLMRNWKIEKTSSSTLPSADEVFFSPGGDKEVCTTCNRLEPAPEPGGIVEPAAWHVDRCMACRPVPSATAL